MGDIGAHRSLFIRFTKKVNDYSIVLPVRKHIFSVLFFVIVVLLFLLLLFIEFYSIDRYVFVRWRQTLRSSVSHTGIIMDTGIINVVSLKNSVQMRRIEITRNRRNA